MPAVSVMLGERGPHMGQLGDMTLGTGHVAVTGMVDDMGSSK